MTLTKEEIAKLENKYKKLSLTIKDGIAIFIISDSTAYNTYAIDLNKTKVTKFKDDDDVRGVKEPLNLDSAISMFDYFIKKDDVPRTISSLKNKNGEYEVELAGLVNFKKSFTFSTLDIQGGDVVNKHPIVQVTNPLLPEYKGKGIGSRVYKTVIDKYGSLKSDYLVSSQALRLYLSAASKGNAELIVNDKPLPNGWYFEYNIKRPSPRLNKAIKVFSKEGNQITIDSRDIYFLLHKKPDPKRIEKVSPKTIQYINDSKKKAGIKPTGPIKLTTLRDAAKRAPKETKKSASKKDWWDFMSYEEQKNYLKAYPNSKKKITKKPS